MAEPCLRSVPGCHSPKTTPCIVLYLQYRDGSRSAPCLVTKFAYMRGCSIARLMRSCHFIDLIASGRNAAPSFWTCLCFQAIFSFALLQRSEGELFGYLAYCLWSVPVTKH